ncbi:MAG: DMT family transporter [Streptosporangiales bacterium]
MTYLLLAAAILCEVSGTVALRLSEGFSKLGPSVFAIAGYVAALGLLSIVLKRGLTIGVTYAIWSACGIALVAFIGALAFDERLSWIQIAGVGFVIAGVAALELGGSH